MITEQEFKNAVRTIEKYKNQCEREISIFEMKKRTAEEVLAKENNYGLTEATKICNVAYFSVRTINCIRTLFDKPESEISLGDIATKNKHDLLAIRCFGRKSLAEIEELFIKANINWK